MPHAYNFIKKRPWHRLFPVNFAKFLRSRFLQNTSPATTCRAGLFLYPWGIERDQWHEVGWTIMILKFSWSILLKIAISSNLISFSWKMKYLESLFYVKNYFRIKLILAWFRCLYFTPFSDISGVFEQVICFSKLLGNFACKAENSNWQPSFFLSWVRHFEGT